MEVPSGCVGGPRGLHRLPVSSQRYYFSGGGRRGDPEGGDHD